MKSVALNWLALQNVPYKQYSYKSTCSIVYAHSLRRMICMFQVLSLQKRKHYFDITYFIWSIIGEERE